MANFLYLLWEIRWTALMIVPVLVVDDPTTRIAAVLAALTWVLAAAIVAAFSRDLQQPA